MAAKQATFKDVEVGKKFICFDPKISLHNTIPVLTKMKPLRDDAGNTFNVLFSESAEFSWLNDDKKIIRVY